MATIECIDCMSPQTVDSSAVQTGSVSPSSQAYFWFGREEPKHVSAVLRIYERHFHVCRRRPGSRAPDVFVGRVNRLALVNSVDTTAVTPPCSPSSPAGGRSRISLSPPAKQCSVLPLTRSMSNSLLHGRTDSASDLSRCSSSSSDAEPAALVTVDEVQVLQYNYVPYGCSLPVVETIYSRTSWDEDGLPQHFRQIDQHECRFPLFVVVPLALLYSFGGMLIVVGLVLNSMFVLCCWVFVTDDACAQKVVGVRSVLYSRPVWTSRSDYCASAELVAIPVGYASCQLPLCPSAASVGLLSSCGDDVHPSRQPAAAASDPCTPPATPSKASGQSVAVPVEEDAKAPPTGSDDDLCMLVRTSFELLSVNTALPVDDARSDDDDDAVTALRNLCSSVLSPSVSSLPEFSLEFLEDQDDALDVEASDEEAGWSSSDDDSDDDEEEDKVDGSDHW